MSSCRGALLIDEDLRFFARYPGFCHVVKASWEVLVPKIDAIAEFALLSQEEGFDGAINYAAVTVFNNAHKTKLLRDLDVFFYDYNFEEEIPLFDETDFNIAKVIARVCVLTDRECSDDRQEIVRNCGGQ